MPEQVALKVLVHYKAKVDPSFDMETCVPSTRHLKEMIRCAFEAWDVDQTGSLTFGEFSDAMQNAGLIVSAKQMRILFDRIDCFQYNGEVSLDDLCICPGPVVNRTLAEIQGSVAMDETTNNLHDAMAQLDEIHGERARAMEEQLAQRRQQAEAEAEARRAAAAGELGAEPELRLLLEGAGTRALSGAQVAHAMGLLDALGRGGDEASRGRRRQQLKGQRGRGTTSGSTAYVLAGIGGPQALPAAGRALASVTVEVPAEEAAQRRLGRFLKDERARPPPQAEPVGFFESVSTGLFGGGGGAPRKGPGSPGPKPPRSPAAAAAAGEDSSDSDAGNGDGGPRIRMGGADGGPRASSSSRGRSAVQFEVPAVLPGKRSLQPTGRVGLGGGTVDGTSL